MVERRKCILFLCVANSARSQMAEGIARSLAPRDVQVFSAGSAPQFVHPMAVAAMRARGLDVAAQTSKGLDDVPLDAVDTVITLCEEEFCPDLGTSVERLHWPMPDPAAAGEAEALPAFTAVADQLESRIAGLFAR